MWKPNISWFKHVQKILDDDINDDHGTVLQGFSRTFAPCCALYALIRALQPLVLHHHRLARCARGSPVKLWGASPVSFSGTATANAGCCAVLEKSRQGSDAVSARNPWRINAVSHGICQEKAKVLASVAAIGGPMYPSKSSNTNPATQPSASDWNQFLPTHIVFSQWINISKNIFGGLLKSSH